MSLLGATILTAIATLALAVFALITAVLAYMAWRKQSREVHDQAEMLRVQSDQLEEQRKLNERQTPVLRLQAEELRESLDERKRELADRLRSQAARVTAWFDVAPGPHNNFNTRGAIIRNASNQPIFDVSAFFYQVREATPGSPWEPVDRSPAEKPIRVFPPESDRHVGASTVIQDAGARGIAEYVVSIEFTDAAGNRWERDPRGALNQRL
jgi:hypothetical protein